MKVLWFCNVKFSDNKITGTGSWLVAMADALVQSDKVELFNITTGITKLVKRADNSGVKQWVVPYTRLNKKGMPPSRIIIEIQEIVDEIKPDIIHIWGTESYWGLLTARGLIRGNVILEIQGLTSKIKKHVYSNLSFWDIINCISIKEILRPSSSLISLKNSYKKWSIYEREIIIGHSYISTQSDWVRSCIKYINPHAKIFCTKIPLRKEFFQAVNKWDLNKCNKFSVFTSASATLPFKGLSVLIDAIELLKKSFPSIKLNIAGQISNGVQQTGYTKFIKKRIESLGLTENVVWLGALNAGGIISKLIESHVAVVPSFVESYCVALKEAITIGIPAVASYAGAMPELGKNNKMVSYFPPGDASMCAYSIEKIFANEDMSNKALNKNTLTDQTNTDIDASNLQIEIYKLAIRQTENL